jgi:hypothetical protein
VELVVDRMQSSNHPLDHLDHLRVGSRFPPVVDEASDIHFEAVKDGIGRSDQPVCSWTETAALPARV